MRQLFLILILCYTNVLFAAQDDEKKLEDKPLVIKSIDELKDRVEEVLKYHAVPGAAIAVVDKQGVRMQAGFGFANLERKTRASAETLFRIGSISKMFVGLAALKLEEEGRLDLNANLRDLAPEIEFVNQWQDSNPVKIIHLLQHTAGWDDIHLAEYAKEGGDDFSLIEGLHFHPHSRTSRWKPGERMSYCNSGPPVVAYVIEKITGQKFEDYIQEQFFQPLEMTSATYYEPQDSMLTATLYENNTPVDYWHIIMRPSGSVNATARDMSGLVQFFVNRGEYNGERILSVSSLRRMEQSSTTLAANAGVESGYGITNYTTPYKHYVFHGHNGGVQGGLAELSYNSDLGIGFAFMINSGSSSAFDDISDAIKSYVTYGLSGPKLPQAKPFNADYVERYLGYYQIANPRQEISRFFEQLLTARELLVKDAHLVLDGSDRKQKYVPINERTYRLEDRSIPSLVLLEDDQGLALDVATQYYQKVSPITYYGRLIVTYLFLTLVALNILWFFIWGVRKLNRSIPGGAAIQIRLWPFMSSLSIVAAAALLIYGSLNDIFAVLGTTTFTALSVYALTLLFPIFTVIGWVQNIRYWSATINRWSRAFSIISLLSFSAMTILLWSYQLIGLKTFG